MNTPVGNPLSDLQARVAELQQDLTLRDQRRLERRLSAAHKIKNSDVVRRTADEIDAELIDAVSRLATRREKVPQVSYPAELPISARVEDIRDAVRDHQVVILAGETGSGKTTQLPKICLELGRGVRGMIGHTQPRRLAARTVAERIASELGVELGGPIGYQVRFTARTGDDTLVKVMTDGILLAEIQQDRSLSRYDTLIIDEAHERSLNIDFLLGYLRRLLPRRPDLKLIITSATIDPQRFSRHFGDAPVIEVSGRTYPVEVRYRPVEDAEEPDPIQSIVDAVAELRGEGSGDVLVFLSGEREIRDTADALRRADFPQTEILPLFARLSAAEQHRIFAPHAGRRVVLATNVAETSLTVPGIKYVIDPGTARISRYSHRLKVQRLPIEAVSQASANQRKGRCGRLAPGICIRLYSEADFLGRPEFTEPEILRTNLASVILQMASLGLGEVTAFPFIDPPDRRQVRDGMDLLYELGALRSDGASSEQAASSAGGARGGDRLTTMGRQLAQLPVDPRLGRMVLAAADNGCVREVLVIAAALSIQDPRERPADKQAQADQAHARFTDKDSDFGSYLNLWNYLHEKQKEDSGSALRRRCRAEYLNYLRLREWQDIYRQLREVVSGALGIALSREIAAPDLIHQSLLAGLLSHIGQWDKDKRDYLGARGVRFAIFPGSGLFRKSPSWVMVAELVETSRLWGRVGARIRPEWIEPLAKHLVKRSYSEPHWEKKAGAVLATEKVTLYGVPIVSARTVNYGSVDPVLSRDLFIRNALVEGDWQTHHQFFQHNRELLGDAEELEHRARRRDIVIDDETLFAFYDQRIPAEVVSGRHFDSWWKKTLRVSPDLLDFDLSMLLASPGSVRVEDYPDTWTQGELRLPLSYQFEPGSEVDGVTVHIPLAVLNQVRPEGFDWQVPGLREELVTALIRSLPKPLRRYFVPVPDHARAFLADVSPSGRLIDVLGHHLHRRAGTPIPSESWQLDRVPTHLLMTYRVEDEKGTIVAQGKDLIALREQLAGRARAELSADAAGLERSGLKDWDVGTLPQVFEQTRGGYAVRGYPSLHDEGGTVAVRVLGSPAEQQSAMWAGTRRLLLLSLPSPLKYASGQLSNVDKLALGRNPHGGVGALLEDCAVAAVDALLAEAGGPVWDADSYAKLRERVRAGFHPTVMELLRLTRPVLTRWFELDQDLRRTTNLVLVGSLTDIRNHLAALVYPGFVAATGARRLCDLPRYLEALSRRLAKLAENPGRDRERMREANEVEEEYAALRAELPRSEELDQIRWMIEELRVHLFAQALGTPYPVSATRIYRAMDQVPA